MDLVFEAPIGALIIFSMRVIDVSLSMMRMIFAVRGHRGLAAFVGFFEVAIWLVATGHVIGHLNSPLHILGFAAGFATGNYVGVWLEGRFAVGIHAVHAVFRNGQGGSRSADAARILREAGFAVTEMAGRGGESEVDILRTVILRRRVPEVVRTLQEADPNAFVTVEEIRSTKGGYIASGQGLFGGFPRPGGRKLPFLTRF